MWFRVAENEWINTDIFWRVRATHTYHPGSVFYDDIQGRTHDGDVLVLEAWMAEPQGARQLFAGDLARDILIAMGMADVVCEDETPTKWVTPFGEKPIV